MPTSVPNPYLNPSANRVEQLTKMFADDKERVNNAAASWCSVGAQKIASVWCEPCVFIWSIGSHGAIVVGLPKTIGIRQQSVTHVGQRMHCKRKTSDVHSSTTIIQTQI